MMKLSPQQVQYLKMLQLPTLALEQKIKAELEMNPLLEEGFEEEQEQNQEEPATARSPSTRRRRPPTRRRRSQAEEDKYTIDDYMNDDTVGLQDPASRSTTRNRRSSRWPTRSRCTTGCWSS